MRSDEYYRLYMACVAMAKQSTDFEVQARWLAMADTWLRWATERREPSSATQRTLPTSTSSNRQLEDSVQGTQSRWRQPRRQSGRDSKPLNFHFSIRTREKTD